MINSRSSGASKLALIGLFTLIALMLTAGGYWYYRISEAGDHARLIAFLTLVLVVLSGV